MTNNPTVNNVGASTIVHKLTNDVNFREQLDVIAKICKEHPKGKALSIFNVQGKQIYSLTIEESIF